MKRQFVETSESIAVRGIGEDSCVIRTGDSELVLSYDAAFDLALRLASFIQDMDHQDIPSPKLH